MQLFCGYANAAVDNLRECRHLLVIEEIRNNKEEIRNDGIRTGKLRRKQAFARWYFFYRGG